MTNKNKRNGSDFEKAVAEYLGCERRVQGGSLDRGDIAGFFFANERFVLEVKAERAMDISGALKEAEKEAENDNAPLYAAVFKKRMASVDKAYVVMPLWMLRMLKGLGDG